MKNLFLLAIFYIGVGVAQQMPGAGFRLPDSHIDLQHSNITSSNVTTTNDSGFVFSTTTYTFSDLVVFSYFNNSRFNLYDQSGMKIDSISLNSDEYHSFKPNSGQGIYRITGNQSFTLLVGDPVTNNIMGFYAVDQAGKPLSTHLETFMPKYWSGSERFIVFAYSDGTEYTIKNLSDSTTIAAGIINKGEHVALNDVQGKFLKVTANNLVSALSYADQGYFVPADNGTFSGINFYGFSGYIGSWLNGIVVTAYNDSTEYLILNTVTGDTIQSGMLQYAEVASPTISSETYFQVITNKSVTVSNTPYAGWSGNYYYLTRQIDESGQGIGTHFITPVTPGSFDIFSFEENNHVLIKNTVTGDTTYDATLAKGEHYNFTSSKTIYDISGTANLSAIASYGGGFGADFVPLNFATGLPDLAISSRDIIFDPDTVQNVGDPILITAMIHNYGYTTAYDIPVEFFDGDPAGGNTISGLLTIDSIPPGTAETMQTQWNTPANPEYHAVHVAIDYEQTILESNTSNNSAFKNLVPNKDLLPPLVTIIEAPASVNIATGDTLEFNTFDIQVQVFNSGTVMADTVTTLLHLPIGLTIVDGSDSLFTIGNMASNATATHTWRVHINSFQDIAAFFYTVTVDAKNAEAKDVNRMLVINYPTGLERKDRAHAPENFALLQNYPNPFNPTTNIEFHVNKTSQIVLDVYDLSGRKVETLVQSRLEPGFYKTRFDGKGRSSGIYFVRLQIDGLERGFMKMTLIK